MAKLTKNVAVEMDENMVDNNGQVQVDGTVKKQFGLSRDNDSQWPSGPDGKPISLRFNVVVDMSDVSHAQILADALRTKIIRLQAALRKSGSSFEALKEMASQPIRKHYNMLGTGIENPEKQLTKALELLESLPPELQAEARKRLGI